MTRLGIGVQLYTLRDDMAADLEGTLRKVAELGYEGIEFAGYYDYDAAALKGLVDELGLKVIGSHVSLKNIQADLQKEIDYVKTLGGQYLICPHVALEDRDTADKWKQVFAIFEQAGSEAKKQGLQFLYHNHAFEFESEIDGQFVFDALYTATSSEHVKVEMDVCWVQFAGQDPLAYIAKYAGRLPLVHFKDFTKDAEGSIVTLELGLGDVPLKDVITAATGAGAEWLIVEQDRCQKPPLTSVANSLNWIKENYL
jgi:sugar phosphate isomerase/epimerase